MKNYKCIVIGSGPGGATTALEFVKKGIDVLLLEKGSNTPLNKLQEYTSTEMNQKYKNSGLTASMGNHLINYAEGSCLGGGSEVNSGLYHEIPEMILEKWEEKNKIKFDRNELKESYEYVKNILDISYMPENLIPDASKRLKHGSDKFGWQCSEIPRWYSYKSDPLGKRMSISETLIPEFLQNGGELLESCNVIKVKKGRKNKNIVQVMNANGERFDLQAEFLVIAGGSIDTPNLLLKSGYRHNIGKGLKMHPSFKFTALFDEKINNKNMGVPVHQVKEFSPQISMGCSISSKQFIALGLNDTSNIAHLDS